MLWLALGVAASSASAAPVNFQYVYDDNGRLTEVTDSTGNVIAYAYDPVGNILSVTRSALANPNALAVFGVAPQTVSVGAALTIQGQGFSATTAANVVAINGTPAPVLTATGTALVVTVPPTATSGLVAVTVGSATAYSASPVTILATPAVQSITPSAVLQGTGAVTVTVKGVNLGSAAFSFLPAAVPPVIAVSNLSINAAGTVATMTFTPVATAVGGYTLIGTNSAGSSSILPTSENTFLVVSSNASTDTDGDGLTDLFELAIGSNPVLPSTSRTGIADGWAVYAGLNPTDPTIGTRTAPDGLTYLQAYQQGLNPLIPSLAPPTVSAVFPANGAPAVPTNSVIVTRFSTPVQGGIPLNAVQSALSAIVAPSAAFDGNNLQSAALTLQGFLQRTCCGNAATSGAVQLLQSGRVIPGAVMLSNDQLSLTFIPAQPLSSGTTYTVSAQGVRDLAGIALAQPYVWTLTTGLGPDLTPPSVVLSSPSAGFGNAPANAPIRIRFSKPMDPSTLTPQTFVVTDSTSGLIQPGMVQVDSGGMTAAFVGQSGLPPARTINVSLQYASIRDTAGNSLQPTGASFSFSTAPRIDSSGPQVKGLSPGPGAVAVPTNARVEFELDRPVDWISAIDALSVQQGANVVLGAVALSDGNRRVTFTPTMPLGANLPYTATLSSRLLDLGGLPLASSAVTSFQTASAPDTTGLKVANFNPVGTAPMNTVVQVKFSKPVDGASLASMGAFVVAGASPAGPNVAGALTLSSDGTTASFTPSAGLLSGTTYSVSLNGITDLVGNSLGSTSWTFTTASTAQTTPLSVISFSPSRAATGVPINGRVGIVFGSPVDPLSVAGGALTVTAAGGTVVAGTLTLASDGVTVTFVPASALLPSTGYTVQIAGITDMAGNAPAPSSTWSFTTGTSGLSAGGLNVTATAPQSGVVGVAVTSPVTVTFNAAVDPTTVNTQTVWVADTALSGSPAIAASLLTTGNSVTITPLTPWPGGATLAIVVAAGVKDLAGNNGIVNPPYTATFTTAPTTDNAPLTVASVTPGNGSAQVGLNAPVVVTFSKSVNPATVTNSTLGLFLSGASRVGGIASISSDNRTVVLNTGTLPAGATVTVVAIKAIRDLSGNPLVDFSSQFTTSANPVTGAPAVIGQRPGNGGTAVPLGTNVVVYVSRSLNPATVTSGTVHLVQNGQSLAGTVSLSGNGQVITFQPVAPLSPATPTQVYLDAAITDLSGNALVGYEGAFTTDANPVSVVPTVTAQSPIANSSWNILNPEIALAYNTPLLPASVNAATVVLTSGSPTGPVVALRLGLDATGRVIIAQAVDGSGNPLALQPQTTYYLTSTAAIQSLSGTPQGTQYQTAFLTGTSTTDTSAPIVKAVSPPPGATGVGDNARIVVRFSKPVNPLTVNASTVLVTGGTGPLIDASISFADANATAILTPQGVLPDARTLSVTVSGVQDTAGHAVTPFTSTFTVGTAPDFTPPVAVATNPVAGQSQVPTNAPITVVANKALDPNSIVQSSSPAPGSPNAVIQQVNLAPYVNIQDLLAATPVGTSIGNALSPLSLVPFTLLDANKVPNAWFSSTPGTSVDIKTSIAGATTVYTLFNSIWGQPGLLEATIQFVGSAGASQTFSLVANTDVRDFNNYTWSNSINGVTSQEWWTNNLDPVPFDQSRRLDVQAFTLSPAFTNQTLTDIIVTTGPNVAQVYGAPILLGVSVQQSRQNALIVHDNQTGTDLAGTTSVSADGRSMTFAPAAPLGAGDPISVFFNGRGATDLAGNLLGSAGLTDFAFTAGPGPDLSGPQVTGTSPVNAFSGAPLNSQVAIRFDRPVDTATLGQVTLMQAGQTVPVTLSLSSGDTQVVITPQALLQPTTTYSLSIAGVADLAGNLISAPISQNFTTGTEASFGPLLVVSTNASGAGTVPKNSPLQVFFNHAANPLSLNAGSFYVQPAAGTAAPVAATISLSADGLTATLTPTSQLLGGASYTLVLTKAASDLSGAAPTATSTWTFITGP